MTNKYLKLMSKEYPTIDSVASEMVNLSAIRSLPKGTEYFFSDLHGEYEAFLHMLKSASGMIMKKIDIVFGKTVSSAERENLANLIYYPEKEIKSLRSKGLITDEWKRLTIYRLSLSAQKHLARTIRRKVSYPVFVGVMLVQALPCRVSLLRFVMIISKRLTTLPSLRERVRKSNAKSIRFKAVKESHRSALKFVVFRFIKHTPRNFIAVKTAVKIRVFVAFYQFLN